MCNIGDTSRQFHNSDNLSNLNVNVNFTFECFLSGLPGEKCLFHSWYYAIAIYHRYIVSEWILISAIKMSIQQFIIVVLIYLLGICWHDSLITFCQTHKSNEIFFYYLIFHDHEHEHDGQWITFYSFNLHKITAIKTIHAMLVCNAVTTFFFA